MAMKTFHVHGKTNRTLFRKVNSKRLRIRIASRNQGTHDRIIKWLFLANYKLFKRKGWTYVSIFNREEFLKFIQFSDKHLNDKSRVEDIQKVITEMAW